MSDTTLIGMYPNVRSAEHVVRALVAAGVSAEDIGLVTHQARERLAELTLPPLRAEYRDPVSSTLGGTLLGATFGALIALMVGILPALEATVGAQPSILVGAVIGAVLGAAIGAVVSLRRRPAQLELGALEAPEVLVLVDATRGPAARIERLMQPSDFVAIERTSRPWRALGWPELHPLSPAMVRAPAREVHGTADVHRAAFQLGTLIACAGTEDGWPAVEAIARARWETGPHASTAFRHVLDDVREGYETARAAPV